VIQRCYNGVPMVLQWFYNGCTANADLCVRCGASQYVISNLSTDVLPDLVSIMVHTKLCLKDHQEKKHMLYITKYILCVQKRMLCLEKYMLCVEKCMLCVRRCEYARVVPAWWCNR
jgi:hypothetical protein